MTLDMTPLPGMIGRHPAMRDLYGLVRRAARSGLPVLITGETGTGKELVARALHDLAGDARRPLVDVNCAAVPENLAEGEFFGWERGAFTGAHREQVGLVEAANGGTLFLDEACSLSLALQAKLLRVLEHRDFRRVGGRQRLASQFRLVAAVSEPLSGLLASGRWRADFAYRVAVVRVTLPPLRHRRADIRLLMEHFLSTARRNGHPSPTLDPPALDALARYSWPGNVRELRAVAEQLATLVDSPTVTVAHVLPFLDAWHGNGNERDLVAAALAAHGGRVRAAARALGVGHTKLYQLIRRFGLTQPAPSVRTDGQIVRTDNKASTATTATDSVTMG
jgi:DNA-binding NtrC family response regulator